MLIRCFVVNFAACLASVLCQPSVKTALGTIQGIEQNEMFLGKSYNGNAYLGIPYAKPPIGRLRFQKPEPYGPFDGTLEAKSFGSSCPQSRMEHISFGVYSDNEDCLFLDIYVPRSQPDSHSGYAVMIWIHGGGFMLGSGSMTKGNVLAAYGNVIVVTLNYRLGMFGFLDIDDERAPGNVGLFDQQLAIKWVKDHIGSFGGDSSRMTIFGESAGGMSVHMHALFPENRGLFQNVISQSGTATLPFLVGENNIDVATSLAKRLQCSSESMDDIIECLQMVGTARFMEVCGENPLDMNEPGLVNFNPTIDGQFIKRDPRIVLQDIDSEEIKFMQELNIINGVNGLEGASFTLMFEDSENVEITNENMTSTYISSMLPAVFPGQKIPDAVKALIDLEYTNWQNPNDARMKYVIYNSDMFFNVPAWELHVAQANNIRANSWLYNFVPRPELQLAPLPSWIEQANHGDEIQFVFGYDFDYTQIGRNMTDFVAPQWEQEVSGRVMRFWSNLAKFGYAINVFLSTLVKMLT